MEIEAYTGAVVAGVPLMFVVIGLVQWVKSFGVTGNLLRVVSMIIGLVFGGGYIFATVGFPATFAEWFAAVVYGIGLGIVASGVYDALKNMMVAKPEG
jgi:hypothetical protein